MAEQEKRGESSRARKASSMSFAHGPPKPEDDMIKLIRHAIDSGITFLDTSDVYGPHTNEILVDGELKKLVEEGKIKYVGLSEACGSTIRRAHAVHPITSKRIEWSPWTVDVEEDIIPTCRELGIGIVPYSPLGRGFFSLWPKITRTSHKLTSESKFRGSIRRTWIITSTYLRG
ncbi:hypothetical protein Dimus_032055 [Dionaea muscipula]